MQRGYADTLPPLFRYVKTFLSSFVDSIRYPVILLYSCPPSTIYRSILAVASYSFITAHSAPSPSSGSSCNRTPDGNAVRRSTPASKALIGRTLPLMNGTPAHAVTQAMLAEHKHGIFHRFFRRPPLRSALRALYRTKRASGFITFPRYR